MVIWIHEKKQRTSVKVITVIKDSIKHILFLPNLDSNYRKPTPTSVYNDTACLYEECNVSAVKHTGGWWGKVVLEKLNGTV